MGKNNNQRFFIDSGKQNFEMHKSGKKWVFKRITALTFTLGFAGAVLLSENNIINADNKPTQSGNIQVSQQENNIDGNTANQKVSKPNPTGDNENGQSSVHTDSDKLKQDLFDSNPTVDSKHSQSSQSSVHVDGGTANQSVSNSNQTSDNKHGQSPQSSVNADGDTSKQGVSDSNQVGNNEHGQSSQSSVNANSDTPSQSASDSNANGDNVRTSKITGQLKDVKHFSVNLEQSLSTNDKLGQSNASNDENSGKYHTDTSMTIPVKIVDTNPAKGTHSGLLTQVDPFYGNANTTYTEDIDNDPKTQNSYLQNLGFGGISGTEISGSFDIVFDDKGQATLANDTLQVNTPPYKSTNSVIQVDLHDEKDNPNSKVTQTLTVNYPVQGYVGQSGTLTPNDRDIIGYSKNNDDKDKIPDYYTSGKNSLPSIAYTITSDGVQLSQPGFKVDLYSGAYYNDVPVQLPIEIQDSKNNYRPIIKNITEHVSGYSSEQHIPINLSLLDIISSLNNEYSLSLPDNCTWSSDGNGGTGSGPAYVNLDSNGNAEKINHGMDDNYSIMTPDYHKNMQIQNIPPGVDIDPFSGYNGTTTTKVPTTNIKGGYVTITVNNNGIATVTNKTLPQYTDSASVDIPIVLTDKKDGKNYDYSNVYSQTVGGYEGNPVTIDKIDSQKVINDINSKEGWNLPLTTSVSIDKGQPLTVMIDNSGKDGQGGKGHVKTGKIDVITPDYKKDVEVQVPVSITDDGSQYPSNGSYTTTISGYDGSTVDIPDYNHQDAYKQINLPDGKVLPEGTMTDGTAQATISGNSATAENYHMHATTPAYVTVPVVVPVTVKNSDGSTDYTKNYQANITGYVNNDVSYTAGTPHDDDIIKQLGLPTDTVTTGQAVVHIASSNQANVTSDSVIAQDPQKIDKTPIHFKIEVDNPNANNGNPSYVDVSDPSITVSGFTGDNVAVFDNNDVKSTFLNDVKNKVGLTSNDVAVSTVVDRGNDQIQINYPNSEYDGILVKVPKYEQNVSVSIPVTINDQGNQYPKTENYKTTVSGYDGTTCMINPTGDNILGNLNSNYKLLPKGSTASGESSVTINGMNDNYSINGNTMNVVTPKYISVPVTAEVDKTDERGHSVKEQYKTNVSGYVNNPTSLNPNSSDVKKQLDLPSDSQISGNPIFIPTKPDKPVNANGSINVSLPSYVKNVPVNIEVTIHDEQTNQNYHASYQSDNIEGYTGDSQIIDPDINDVDGKLVPIDGNNLPSNLIVNGKVPTGSIISGTATATINADGKSTTINPDNVTINTPAYVRNIPVKINVAEDNSQGKIVNKPYNTDVSGYAGNDVTIDGSNHSNDVIKQLNLPNGTIISSDATVHIDSENHYTYKPDNNSLLAKYSEFVKIPVAIQVPVTNESDGSKTYKTYNTYIKGYVGNESEDTVPDYNDIKKQFNLTNATQIDGKVNGFISSPSSYSINSTVNADIPAYKQNVPVTISVNIHNESTGTDSQKQYETHVSGYNGTTQIVTPNNNDVIKQLNLPESTTISGSTNVVINNDNGNVTDNNISADIPNHAQSIQVTIPIHIHDDNTGKDWNENYHGTIIGYNGTNQTITPSASDINHQLKNLPANTTISGDTNISISNGKGNLISDNITVNILNTNKDNNSDDKQNVNTDFNYDNSDFYPTDDVNTSDNDNINEVNNNDLNEKNSNDWYLGTKKPLIKISDDVDFFTLDHKEFKYSPNQHPVFRLLNVHKLANNQVMFKVRIHGVVGTFTTNASNVQLAYYQIRDIHNNHKTYAISIHGDYIYINKNHKLSRVNSLKAKHYRKAAHVVNFNNDITKLQLANGDYLSANKYYVKLTEDKPSDVKLDK
ncbi:hypothetical protein [Apilactobacillus xinyiensis]|uniref:hypothetical protein n=1 Tax=Apilactobacillus xinyiensis TaxID=2841032 RepID=UPI00200D8D68|nr:hypothetical protein [Apilactobacillus xinyiensis]MCL0329859.1 hypothetical protein [Apilactobacillus xinyiensis]